MLYDNNIRACTFQKAEDNNMMVTK